MPILNGRIIEAIRNRWSIPTPPKNREPIGAVRGSAAASVHMTYPASDFGKGGPPSPKKLTISTS